MTTINLSWPASPASEFVSSYRILVSTNGGNFNDVGSSPTNSFAFVTNLQAQFAFRIRAVNFVGQSADSATTQGPSSPTPPAAPTIDSIVTS